MPLHAEKNKVLFTYSVSWRKSDVAWASRWDTYLRMNDVEVRACTQPDRRHLGGKGRGKGALCMYMDPPWSKPLDLLWFWSTI